MASPPVLTEHEIAEALRDLSGWKMEDGKLARKYLFPGFADAMAFVNKVAGIAERMNHHPFISIDYRRVTLRLTTWHSGGITGLDIDSAKAYDEE
jgi:4a-hydroxytetrahydrobiopterin dehydratase